MDDQKIIELFWQRLEQAIEETSKKYGSMCHSIAWNLLYNTEDAEECVNDTYYGLWDSIPPTRPLRLPPYIAKITRNLAMKRLSYKNAEKRTAQTISFEELNACIPAHMTTEMQIEEKELTKVLEQFLDTLDRESRNMFLRRYWFFDPIAEIAIGFGMSESKVKTRLFRIRNRLKIYLAEEVHIYVR